MKCDAKFVVTGFKVKKVEQYSVLAGAFGVPRVIIGMLGALGPPLRALQYKQNPQRCQHNPSDLNASLPAFLGLQREALLKKI